MKNLNNAWVFITLILLFAFTGFTMYFNAREEVDFKAIQAILFSLGISFSRFTLVWFAITSKVKNRFGVFLTFSLIIATIELTNYAVEVGNGFLFYFLSVVASFLIEFAAGIKYNDQIKVHAAKSGGKPENHKDIFTAWYREKEALQGKTPTLSQIAKEFSISTYQARKYKKEYNL